MSASRSIRVLLFATLFALIAVLTLWASSARATAILHESFADLVEKSEVIVVGTVLAQQSRYDARRQIYTLWTLGELEMVSGTHADAQLELRVLGGEVDGDRLSVLGAPTFAIGERVLLFVRGNGRYAVPFVGWTQGVFRVRAGGAVEDHDGNRVFGIRDLRVVKERRVEPTAEIVGGPAASTRAAETDAPPYTVDLFVQAIRAQLRSALRAQ